MKPHDEDKERHRTAIPGVDSSLQNIGIASGRGSVWAVSAEGIDFVLRLLAIMVLARLLLPQHFGLISMVTAVTAVAERFKDAGLSVATVQFDEITHEQISNLFWINAAVGLIIALAVGALSFPIATFYGDDRLLKITWAIALSFVFGGMTVQHHALLRRTMQFRPIALVQIGSSLASILLAILVAVLGGEYWSLVVREVSRTGFLMIATWWYMPWRPGRLRRGSGVRRMLGFGGNMMLSDIIHHVTYSLDQVIVGKVSGAAALGLYRQGYNLVTAPAVQIGYPASLVSVPALSRLRDRPEDFRKYLRKLLAILSFVSMPCIFFVVVYAGPLVEVALGSGWEGATPIFRTLALAFFMQPTMTMVGCVTISCGLGRRVIALACLSATTLLLMLSSFAKFGPEGVAFAHVATFFVLLVPKLYLALRGTPATPFLFVSAVWRSLASTLLAGGIMAIFQHFAQFESAILDLGAGVIGGAAVYLGSWLFLFKGRSQFLEILDELRKLRAS